MPEPSRQSSTTKKAALAVGTAGLLVAVFEATLRLGGFESRGHGGGLRAAARRVSRLLDSPNVVADRRLLWRLAPNATFDLGGTPVRTNAEGFRTRAVAPRPPAGACRILFLGGSTAFGWRVRSSARYSDVIARMLAAVCGDSPHEIVNLAEPEYTSLQSLRVFRELGLGLKPRVVVAMVGEHDRDPARERPDDEMAELVAKAAPHPWLRPLGSCRVWQLAAAVHGLLSPRGPRALPRPRVSPPACERNVTALAHSCAANGIQLVLVAAPAGRRFDARRISRRSVYLETVARVARFERVPFVRMTAMRCVSRMPNTQLFSDLRHPNEQGHLVIAAHVIPVLWEVPDVRRPASPDGVTHGEAARRLMREGRVAEAFAHALAGRTLDEPVLPVVLEAYAGMASPEDAIGIALDNVDAVMLSAPCCLALSSAYWSAGMPDSAWDILRHSLRLDPRSEAAQSRMEHLGSILRPSSPHPRPTTRDHYARNVSRALQNRDYLEAVRVAEAAAERFPEWAAFRYWRGEATRLLGDTGTAVSHLTAVARTHRLHGDARLSLALCLAETQREQEALVAVQVAARLMPFSWQAQIAAARIAASVHDPRVGLPAARRAAALAPDRRESRRLLKLLEEMHKRLEGAAR